MNLEEIADIVRSRGSWTGALTIGKVDTLRGMGFRVYVIGITNTGWRCMVFLRAKS